MGVVFAFLVGWVVGARGGAGHFEEVVDAARAIRQSEEFDALVDALRSHLGYTLREIGAWLESEEPAAAVPDVLARVRDIVGRAAPSVPWS